MFYHALKYWVFAFIIICPVFASSVLITGGNRGIGFELVESYLQKGHQVFTTYRSKSDSAQLLAIENPKLHVIEVDFTQPGSIKKIQQSIGEEQPLDIIIHNAAMFPYKANRAPSLDTQDWLDAFMVNTIAPVQITWALLPNLLKGVQKKVIAVSSRRGVHEVNLQDEYEGRYGYRSSKAALNAAMLVLAQDLLTKRIITVMLHPGRVATKMTKFDGVDPKESARNIIAFIERVIIKDSGSMVDVETGKTLLPPIAPRSKL